MSVEFFVELTLLGWLAMLIRLAVLVSIPLKQKWWFNYYERFPQFDMFDDYMYTTARMVAFMCVRFVVIILIVHVITKVMIMI